MWDIEKNPRRHRVWKTASGKKGLKTRNGFICPPSLPETTEGSRKINKEKNQLLLKTLKIRQ